MDEEESAFVSLGVVALEIVKKLEQEDADEWHNVEQVLLERLAVRSRAPA